MAELHHYMKDLYPNMGFTDTTFLSVPEPGDQVAMPDNQELATDMKVKENPQVNANIWKSIGIVLVIVILFGYFGRG